jgi:hypothetical protein
MDDKGLKYGLDLVQYKRRHKVYDFTRCKRDTEIVSSSHAKEIASVKNNFLLMKLNFEK